MAPHKSAEALTMQLWASSPLPGSGRSKCSTLAYLQHLCGVCEVADVTETKDCLHALAGYHWLDGSTAPHVLCYHLGTCEKSQAEQKHCKSQKLMLVSSAESKRNMATCA